MREIEVKILRRAETGNGAYQTYIVPVDETAAVSVMNLLEEIYSKQDRTLSFFSHAACRQAACGKCMVKVNGKVKLACKERVVENKVVLEPYAKKVVKDLICET